MLYSDLSPTTNPVPEAEIEVRHNLPARLLPLICREQELKDIRHLLLSSNIRLLTLTGTGGVGKTHLALQVATTLLDNFSRVYFVSLAAITDSALVLSVIAQTLELKENPGQSLLILLKAYLNQSPSLLVLDNFEQVIQAGPQIAELLATCPTLKVLVTSQTSLRLTGEQEYPVEPLALPLTSELQVMAQVPSVRLFVERASAIKPDFALTPKNESIIAEICTRLDGLPLALELAAARIKLLPPQAMLERLSGKDGFKSLDLLTRGKQELHQRQQTIRNTIAWSYNLLNPAEKRLLRQMAIFVGGCTLEAVGAVCGEEGQKPEDLLDQLEVLVDHSLVKQVETKTGELRFILLTTIREYALEKLEESGEYSQIRKKYQHYFGELLLVLNTKLRGPEYLSSLEKIERDYDNFRAGFTWALANTPNEALRFLVLDYYWHISGQHTERINWLEAIQKRFGYFPSNPNSVIGYPHPPNVDLVLWGRFLCKKASQSFYSNIELKKSLAMLEEALRFGRKTEDKELIKETLIMIGNIHTFDTNEESGSINTISIFEECIRLAEETNDKVAMIHGLNNLSVVYMRSGDNEKAQTQLERTCNLLPEVANQFIYCDILIFIGNLYVHLGNFAQAKAIFTESLTSATKLKYKFGEARALGCLGWVLLYLEEYEMAWEVSNKSIEIREALGDVLGIAFSLRDKATIATEKREFNEACRLFAKSLEIFGQSNQLIGIVSRIARLAQLHGRLGLATQLLGATEALKERSVLTVLEGDLGPFHQKAITETRNALGETAFSRAFDEGKGRPLNQLISEALSETTDPVTQPIVPSAPRPASNPDELTPRELDVIRLVARGLTNGQVAEELVLSPLTVNAYLRSIYSKLGVSSRTAATRYALEQGLV